MTGQFKTILWRSLYVRSTFDSPYFQKVLARVRVRVREAHLSLKEPPEFFSPSSSLQGLIVALFWGEEKPEGDQFN